jgi:hypothetical protein
LAWLGLTPQRRSDSPTSKPLMLCHFEPFLWRTSFENLFASNTYMVNGT